MITWTAAMRAVLPAQPKTNPCTCIADQRNRARARATSVPHSQLKAARGVADAIVNERAYHRGELAGHELDDLL